MKKIGKGLMGTLMALILCIGTGVTAMANSLSGGVVMTGDDRRIWLWVVIVIVVVVVLIIVLLLLRRRNKHNKED